MGELHQEDARTETRVRRWIRNEASQLEIYPVLSSGPLKSETAAHLGSPVARTRLVASISSYLQENSDAGITVALDLPASSHTNLVAFINELAQVLKPKGHKILLALPPTAIRTRVQELARFADLVILDAYQKGQERGNSGPLASQAWFETQMETELANIPRSKLIIGIGSFACDFVGSEQHPAMSVQNAWNLMVKASASLGFDRNALNPRFRFTDPAGLTHDVWILDGVTTFNHMKAALSQAPAGVALWRLGLEDPGAWATFAKGRSPDATARAELEHPPPGHIPLAPNRNMELAQVESQQTTGIRSISYHEQTGLIVHQSMPSVPVANRYTDWSFAKGSVALTFDDGPDEKVTGRILDILAEKSVKATFFVIGRNALQSPQLLRRIYDEGHDVGNHTYSHPLLPDLTAAAMRVELTATQRVMEGLLSINTKLFRPPFAGGALPDTPEVPGIVADASRLGYLTVLGGVQPLDWMNPPATVIRDRVVAQVLAGRGNVIVLHDWGKRQPTIDALPMLIDSLQSKGYEFVTVHELLGKTRSEVMPMAVTSDLSAKITSAIRRESLLAFAGFGLALPWIAVLGGVLCGSRLVFVILAVLRHRRLERSRAALDFWPASVAVVVPAYNEAAVISNTIRSVLAARRTDFDILIVDDGSTDGTAEVVRVEFLNNPRVKVFSKANGGKAAAANFALAHTRADIVVCIDADTVLAPDAIPLLVRHFSDPTVGAVAGTAVVGNIVNLLTRFQSVEYTVGQYLDRRAFALLNANGIVPGAIGAWRRDALLANGGYASDTLAEDADATFSLARAGWKVIYEPAAEARTEAPENIRSFLKQRYRWMFGMLQVISKHRGATFSRTPNGIGWLTIPNVVIFQFGFSFLIPILDSVAIWQLVAAAPYWTRSTDPTVTSSMYGYAQWWIIFLMIDLAVMLAALRIAAVRGSLTILPMLLLQRFCYWPLIYWVAMTTLLAAAKGHFVGWGKLKRTGSVILKPLTVLEKS